MLYKPFGQEEGYRVFLRAHVQSACNCRRKFFWCENPSLGVYWSYIFVAWVAVLLGRPLGQPCVGGTDRVSLNTLILFFYFLRVQHTKCLSLSPAILLFIFCLCVLGTNSSFFGHMFFYSARKYYSLVFIHVCWKQNFSFPSKTVLFFFMCLRHKMCFVQP